MEKVKIDYDVILIGAGISGINAAYRIQTQLPEKSYTILEARGGMGGTWDLFKYPGIRSDSDLYTFGFPWRPWSHQQAIAEGASIVDYVKETANMFGIDKHIQYHQKVVAADWSSDKQIWTLTIEAGGATRTLTAKFVFLSTGYYDYHEPLKAEIPGLSNFKGQVVHPQFWPEKLDYAGKKVVIVGSGATAITLLPNLTDKAEKVTMLQRSPGYIMSLPQVDLFAWLAHKVLPSWIVYRMTRLKFLLLPWIFFNFCRTFPNAARWVMKKRTSRMLPKHIPHDPHFNPAYNPWEQRLCVCPDGDFFKCLRDGKADVATGHIKNVYANHIELVSGQKIDADIIVTATGLKVLMAGGAKLSLDGKPYNIGQHFLWNGVMLQDLPNAAFVIGYTNASWTLGADAAANHICRLLKYMKDNNISSVAPYIEDSSVLKPAPTLNLNSTYIKRAVDVMPKTSGQAPWLARQNYFSDSWTALYGNLTKGLRFQKMAAY